jgi:predicted dehydrogenase
MRTRTVGMVGSGWIAPRHIRAFQANGVTVTALLAPDRAAAERLCAETGIAPRLHATIDEFVGEECDFYDVLVPPKVQPDVVDRLVTRGKPVLCEKPLALGVAAGEKMLAAAKRHGVPLAVMHNQLFHAPVIRAREILLSGEIGEPRIIRLHLVGAHSAASEWKRALQSHGGLVWDDCIHRLYLAEHFMGPVLRVRAMGARAGEENGSSGSVQLSFAGNRLGVLDFSYHLGGEGFYDDSLMVIGTRGVIHLNGGYGSPLPLPPLGVRTAGGWRAEPVAGSWEDSFGALVAYYLEHQELAGGPVLIDAHAALRTVAVAEAIGQSLTSGRETGVDYAGFSQ